jgi:hypothetical protein
VGFFGKIKDAARKTGGSLFDARKLAKDPKAYLKNNLAKAEKARKVLSKLPMQKSLAAIYDVKTLAKDPKAYLKNNVTAKIEDIKFGVNVVIAAKTGNYKKVGELYGGAVVDAANETGLVSVNAAQKEQFMGITGLVAGAAKDFDINNVSGSLSSIAGKQLEKTAKGEDSLFTKSITALTGKVAKKKASSKNSVSAVKDGSDASKSKSRQSREQWAKHAAKKETMGGVYR